MLKNPMLAIALAAAFALGASAAQAQGQKAVSDSKSFIKTAIEGNYAEINVGELAQEKGKSEGVKQFGKMLVEDPPRPTKRRSRRPSKWA